jgi:hypothetical protein
MSTQFDGDDYIDSDDVVTRIAEQLFVVLSNATDEELGRFGAEEDAEQFIEDEDYVRERVRIAEEDSEVDKDELSELREFDEEGRSTFGSSTWESGVRLTDENIITQSFAQERFQDNYGSWPDELDGYIDWERYAEDLTEGVEYARLNGVRYYYL